LSFTITRRFEFDAAHRLFGYDGPCKFIHGHRYILDVSFTSEVLDDSGMVLDFSVIGRRVGGWIKENWDHAFIYNGDDLDACELGRCGKGYLMVGNPTVENMAMELVSVFAVLFGDVVKLSSIRLYETPDCWVDVIV